MNNETPLSKEIERVLISGDLQRLTPEEKVTYYKSVCESIGLNPLTQPLDYILLNGKLRLYAKKDATDQLRRLYDISVEDLKHDYRKDMELYIVTASGKNQDGRKDVSTGAVNVGGLRADNLANAIMKAETKAKRRLTLSLCGLGMLDETELETVAPHPDVPVIMVPAPPTVPPVNQSPATATETPRPREAETVNTPNLAGGEVTVSAPAEKPARKPRAKKEQPPAEENQITDEDVEAAMIPTPPEDRERDEAIAKAVDEMVESASEPEKESPAPEDPVPSKEEMKDITAKIREIAGEGISNQDLKEYFLYSSGKTDPKLITKSEWVRAFEEFHKAKLEGRAKEFIKERKSI